MTIEEKIQRLEKFTSKKMCLCFHLIFLALVMVSIWGRYSKIMTVKELASTEGLTLSQLYSQADLHGTYSGVYVTSTRWLIEGIYETLPLVLFIMIWVFFPVIIRDRRETLEMLKKLQANQRLEPTRANDN